MKKMMTAPQVEANLRTLAQRLSERDIEVEIFVVGGAAMSISLVPDRRMTRDIDAKVTNFAAIEPVVLELAQELNVEADWFNNAVSKLITPGHAFEDWVPWLNIGKVAIYLASSEMLLAMKVVASRIGRDDDDIRALIADLGLATIAEVEEIFERHYPGEVISVKGLKLLELIFAEPKV